MRYRRFGIFLPFMILGAVALFGFIVMQLWNHILPEIAGVKVLSYPQAVGLLVLCRILFGSCRPGRPSFRGGQQHHWRNKLMNMSEHDRARFRKEWRSRHFGGHTPDAEK